MPDIAVSPDELRARAEALVPMLRERALDAEVLRRLPDETVRDLVAAGFIRATLPSRLGGTEIDYRSIMELVAILAHGCASTAWVACNFLSCTFKLALWPREAQDEVWNDSLDALLTGTLVFPAGRARPVDGGYRLSGRWPFGSGIDHADWNFFAATEEDGTLGIFLVPKSDYTIIDTWRAAGLRATGSHHVAVDDMFV
ncbi:MAG TPA: acyl-CoA dehydrogenase, partial [Alphaproteobacteria bacterium]|nr:acyl-CoA dehydrogenase [Alphaproteobacteria bacterium]